MYKLSIYLKFYIKYEKTFQCLKVKKMVHKLLIFYRFNNHVGGLLPPAHAPGKVRRSRITSASRKVQSKHLKSLITLMNKNVITYTVSTPLHDVSTRGLCRAVPNTAYVSRCLVYLSHGPLRWSFRAFPVSFSGKLKNLSAESLKPPHVARPAPLLLTASLPRSHDSHPDARLPQAPTSPTDTWTPPPPPAPAAPPPTPTPPPRPTPP